MVNNVKTNYYNNLLLKHSGKVQLEELPTGNTWKADWLKLRFFNQDYVKLYPTINDALEDDDTLTFTSSIGNYCTVFCKKFLLGFMIPHLQFLLILLTFKNFKSCR